MMKKETTTSPAGKVLEPDKKQQKDEANKGLKETHEQAKETFTEGTADKKKDE
ncbi:DUF4025 domain-containing protein [Bacillus sp. B1-b2]|nr:DUF4025 domain-containing protein [Bacillus sp. B1-b2]